MGAADQGRGPRQVVQPWRVSTCQELPERWSEGLGELTGHLIGDGWLTPLRTGWVYGGDDIDDGLTDSHEGILRELIGGVSRQEMDNGTVQLRAGSEAVRDFFGQIGVSSARAHEKRAPEAIFAAPTEVQAAFLRGLYGADGCVARIESGNKATRYVGLGSRSEALLKDVQRMLSTFGVRGRIYRISEAGRPVLLYTQRRDHCRVRVPGRLRPPDHRLGHGAFRGVDRFLDPAKGGCARDTCSPRLGRYSTKAGVNARRPRGRRPGGRLQPHRAAPPLLHRRRLRRGELLGVHARRRLGLQPGLAQPDEVPPRGRQLRRRRVRARGRHRLPRAGDRRRLLQLPDRGDRRATPTPSASSASATPTSARC